MPKHRQKPSAAQIEAHFKVLRAIHANPSLSQRELSKELGISLGKANYCVQALLEQGWIKAKNIKNSRNKIAYTYRLTPKGVDKMLSLTMAFSKTHQQEFEVLSEEVATLKQEFNNKK